MAAKGSMYPASKPEDTRMSSGLNAYGGRAGWSVERALVRQCVCVWRCHHQQQPRVWTVSPTCMENAKYLEGRDDDAVEGGVVGAVAAAGGEGDVDGVALPLPGAVLRGVPRVGGVVGVLVDADEEHLRRWGVGGWGVCLLRPGRSDEIRGGRGIPRVGGCLGGVGEFAETGEIGWEGRL